MGASVRPHSNDNPFAQPAGVALEPSDPAAPQHRYSTDNPFAQQGETYSPDNPFAPSTIRAAPVVVTPDVLPPAVVSDTAPSPAPPLRMPPVVVEAQPPAPAPAPAPFRAPAIPAAQPDASRVGAPPGSQGTPLAQSDFLTRVAGALITPVLQPVQTARGMVQSLATASKASAEAQAAGDVGMAGGDPNAVERTVSPEDAKNAAIQSATLLALPIAGEAEAFLGSKLAPAVGSRLAGAVARTAIPAAIGSGLMPQDPLVGAVVGGVGGAAHNELSGEPFRPTVTRAITSEPSAMLPEETTPRAPTVTGRVLSPDNPFANEPDFTVETNPAPAPAAPAAPVAPVAPAAPAVEAPEPVAEPVAAAESPSPVPEPVEAAKPSRTGDVIFEDGAKRFVDARTRGGARRDVEKVSTDGLVAELNDVMQRRDDAVRRAQYSNRKDEGGYSTTAGDYVQVATRKGNGPTEQAKALTNMEDADRIAGQLTDELKRRGLSDDDIYERLTSHNDMSEERAGLAEDYNAGKINSDVVRDEQGNVLFSPKRPTVTRATGEKNLFGGDVTEEVPAQTSMFGEHEGTKLAQEDAAKLANHNEAISPEEMSARRDELGAEAKPIAGEDDVGQGALFTPAYHGSPHRFGEFSIHRIGSGEGAQSFGWGLYFASKRNIAEWYRDKLGGKTLLTRRPKGSLYRVEVPEPHTMLQWDEPLNRQPSIVDRALRKFGLVVEFDPHDSGRDGYRMLVDAIKDDPMIVAREPDVAREMFGRQFPSADEIARRAPEAASRLLAKEGVTGIQYLDATARGRGPNGPSHNYVVFDDKLIRLQEAKHGASNDFFSPEPGAENLDRAGTAPAEDQSSTFDDVIDHGAQQATSQPAKGSGIAFTLRQMSERLSRALHHPIREGYFPFGRYQARGVYKPHPEVSRVIDLQDLDVAAHEAGHHIGKKYLGGLDDKETLKQLQNHPGVEDDLRRLGSDLYGPKATNKHLQEGIAELFKWYVVDPAHLKARAPNALRWLEHDIFPREPEVASAFQQARSDFELYQKSPAEQKVSALYAQHSISRPIADIYDAVKRFLRQKLTDDLGEFQQLEREGAIPARAQDDPYLLAMATRTDGAWVTNALNYGIPNATGRRMTVSYKSILDRVPKGKATEWKNYLIAERLLEQASHELKIPDAAGNMRRVNDVLTEAPHLLTGPRGAVVRALLDKKIQSLTGGLESNPQGGSGKVVRAGLTFDEVKDLVEAGRKDAKLSAWADDYWQFNHATLRLLTGHLLTEHETLRILEANEKYVDFHRMFDGEPQGVNASGTGKGFGSNTAGVSRLRGSSRSIGDPLESPVLALYRASRLVHKHEAFEAMAKLVGQTEGLGHTIEEVNPPTDAIRLTIDDNVAKQLKGMGLDPDEVDNLVGAQLVQYVARQFATGRDTRNMVLPRLVKGKRRWYKVGDKRLWEAVQAMGSEEVPEWVRWLEVPARTLRVGTTLVPGFSVGTNWFRDAFDAATYSKGSSRPPFYHFIRGLFHMAKQDAIFHLFEQEGGDVSSQMLYDRQQLPSRLRELSKNKALAEKTVVVKSAADWAHAASELSRRYLVESWLRPLEHLASVPERATRIGETGLVYSELLKKAEAKAKATNQPLTDADRIDIRKRAAEAGREVTLNFARGGTWVRQWNRLAVFLKPSVESIARFGRETGRNGPGRSFTVLARMAAWIGIPAVAAYLAQRKDKDFQSTPQWMKNTGLVFIEHNDDGSFKRRWYFPIPNLEGWLFSVVPTRILEWMDTKNPGALNDIATAFNETVRPGMTPTAAVPIIENDRNRSFFGDRPIEPSGLEQLEPGYRATPETGEAARLLGEKTGISPAKAENLVRGYTGGLGDVALKGADKVVHAVAGAMGKPQEVNSIRDVDPLHTAPVVGRFARGAGSAMSSEWVQQFYDTWTKNNQYRATLIDLRKQGRDAEADAYLDKHINEIATVASASELHPSTPGAKPGPLREAHDALTQLRQRMDMLSRDQLTPQEYRAQLAEVNEQMLMVARRALEAAGIRVMPTGSPEP